MYLCTGTFVLSKNTAKQSYSGHAYKEFVITTKSDSFPQHSLKSMY